MRNSVLRIGLLLLLTLPCLAQDKRGQSSPSAAEGSAKLTREKQVELVLARINEHRRAVGLAAVVEDPRRSEGCQRHADYLRLNPDLAGGPSAHTEDSSRPGYSEVGKKSAGPAMIGQHPNLKDPAWVVDNLLATLYHRLPFVSRGLQSVGIGSARFGEAGYFVVLDASHREIGEKGQDPICFPAADQTDVPLSFAHGLTEWPNPIPGEGESAGYPVTVTQAPNAWQPGEVEMSLADGKGTVACWFSSPDKPARKDRRQQGAFCLIPKEPLKPKTTYTVTFKCKKYGIEKTPEWTKTWSFTTAAK